MKLRLFGRKPRADDEEAENGVSTGTGTKKTRRKKVEPPRQWGRNERIFVFAVLLAMVGTGVFLALSARSWKLPGLPRISVPKPVFQETFVFDSKPPAEDISSVVDNFNAITKNATGVYGFYVIKLTSDEAYGVNEQEVYQAASLIKLPVMAAMYKEHEKKRLNLDGMYTLRNEDKIGGSGSLFYQPEGTTYSYRELVGLMGKQSDNTAFGLSRALLGDGLINEYIRAIGLLHTSLAKNETTPRDIGLFYKKLWKGELVSIEHRDEILEYLTDTIYEDWLPAGIEDAKVAHKFGRELNVVNDAGIVLSQRPYVLVIMSKGIIEREANLLLPQVAALVHEFETGGR